jgi:hypothetical protein
MRAKLFLFPLAAAMLFLTGCDLEDFGDGGRYQRDFHYNYPLKAGGRLTVESFNGSVEVTGWDQDTVDISGVKYGPTQEAADALRIAIDNTPEAVSVRAVRPSERRNNQGAKFIIKVPRTALLDRITSSNGSIRTLDGAGPARLRTSNGSIRVEALRGSLDAQTSNASVELLDVGGDASVHSSNGHIRVDRLLGSLDATTSNSSIQAKLSEAAKAVRLESSNGSVEVSLPAKFSNDLHVATSNSSITVRIPTEPSARLVARTSNSNITSDWEVRTTGAINKNHLEGTLGAGGSLIDLQTSNGGIRLLRM